MDPNNNQPIQPIQPIDTNPLGQAAVPEQPVIPQPTAPVMETVPPMPQPQPTFTPTPPPPAPEPVAPPPVTPVIPTVMMPQAPKQGSKLPMLLIILLILILGMGGYIMFARNQIEVQQKAATENTSIIVPPTPTPTLAPATVDDVNIASPEADLNGLDKDVQGL